MYQEGISGATAEFLNVLYQVQLIESNRDDPLSSSTILWTGCLERKLK